MNGTIHPLGSVPAGAAECRNLRPHGQTAARMLALCCGCFTSELAESLASALGTEVVVAEPRTLAAVESACSEPFDFVVAGYEGGAFGGDAMRFEGALDACGCAACLMVVAPRALSSFVLPAGVESDFAMAGSSLPELAYRARRLLEESLSGGGKDVVRSGSILIDLATYQVKVDGVPIDLTFTEYSLLSFLATHPGRTFSREVLLSQVWGFDYYGGSRTVDVHVRRLRAKLGPEAAQHLETVRGAGYLWTR